MEHSAIFSNFVTTEFVSVYTYVHSMHGYSEQYKHTYNGTTIFSDIHISYLLNNYNTTFFYFVDWAWNINIVELYLMQIINFDTDNKIHTHIHFNLSLYML